VKGHPRVVALTKENRKRINGKAVRIRHCPATVNAETWAKKPLEPHSGKARPWFVDA